MSTPHLDHLTYLKTLQGTQITQFKLDLVLNNVAIEPWLEQALAPYMIRALTSWLPDIAKQEQPLAITEVEAEIAATQAELKRLISLLEQLKGA